MSDTETPQDPRLKEFTDVLELVKKTHKPALKPLSKNNLIDIIVQLTATSIMLQDQLAVAKALQEQE